MDKFLKCLSNNQIRHFLFERLDEIDAIIELWSHMFFYKRNTHRKINNLTTCNIQIKLKLLKGTLNQCRNISLKNDAK